MEEYYLTENTEETRQLSQNLVGLLSSNEESNRQLGLEMILGGGINSVFFYELLFLYVWNKNSKTKNMAEQILEKFLPTDEFLYLKSHCKSYYNNPREDAITNYLKVLCHYPSIDANQLGILFYKKLDRGKRFCLNQPLAFLKVCRSIMKNNVLKLTSLKLEKLHKNISQLSGLKIIYLNNNQLTEIPKEIVDLKRLSKFYLQKNKIKHFPEVLFNLSSLKSLSLEGNKIKILPKEIQKLEKLENLNLKGNKLTELPDSIYSLKKLKTLDLDKNPLKKKAMLAEKFREALPNCIVTLNQ